MQRVAGRIAYRAVRNRGTIGGSLAHADPAADWLSALSLLGAEAVGWTPQGSRSVAVGELARCRRSPPCSSRNELIRAVRVPKLAVGAR